VAFHKLFHTNIHFVDVSLTNVAYISLVYTVGIELFRSLPLLYIQL